MSEEKETAIFPAGSRVAHVRFPNVGGNVTDEPTPTYRAVVWDDCGFRCGADHLLHVSELTPEGSSQ